MQNGVICLAINSDSNGISPSKRVHKYGAQDVTSDLNITDCFAPLRPCKFFYELGDVQKVAHIEANQMLFVPSKSIGIFF